MKGRIYEVRKGFQVRFGRNITKWFKNREEAERFLTGLRYENDKGTFDLRDYAPGKPLAFSTLSAQYLNQKRRSVKRRSFTNLKRYMAAAVEAWGDANIKSIGYAEIEDLLYSQNVSDKTRSNMKSCLYNFWTWLRQRRVITLAQFPEFPTIKYELAWRNLIDPETQAAVVDEVHRISSDTNIKIWLGIKWLSVYIAIRPGELLNIQEKHIDVHNGLLFIPHPKEKRPKIIPLLDDDIALLKEMPRGLPDLYFFRHASMGKGTKAGQRFGQRYFYKWWKKACANLGIEGVDLYGGTRHSTATALGKVMSPEQIKVGTMHSTNKAFERYFQGRAQDARQVYQMAPVQQHFNNQKKSEDKGKLLEFKQ